MKRYMNSIMGTSPSHSHSHSQMKMSNMQVPQDELIEMTEPDESIVLTDSQQNFMCSIIAGAGSGMASSVACAPLDLVRTRMQVMGSLEGGGGTTPSMSLLSSMKEIVHRDGVRGCFRGLGAALVTVPTFWGIYFPLYEQCKQDMHERFGYATSSPVIHMTSAVSAGAIADFFCNPLFVVRTRMQTEVLHYMEVQQKERVPHGMIKTVQLLYKEGGIPIFWRGFTASLLGLSHVGIQFPVYEYLKAEARKSSTKDEESAFDLLIASGLSKMIATSVTYPHEVVRSRLMDDRGKDETKRGLLRTTKRIIREEGFLAMYAGIHVSLVRVLPNCCITFMTYEMLLRFAKKQLADEGYE
mmetsp:Transcript_7934/g.9210  ORF Transcript_7934/g.9210 Transcript_7934/m.9210 type:complete len:355 (+) Transcript_7934:22-1086(+)